MSMHIPMILAGTLLAVPVVYDAQCEHFDPGAARGDAAPIEATLVQPTAELSAQEQVAKLEELGKRVFFDKISIPKRMSCATCHDPAAGWTLKNAGVNLHQVAVTGADPHTAGTLKTPTMAYVNGDGEFRSCDVFPAGFCGGTFWNGRAEGNEVALFPGATAHIGDEVFEEVPGLKPVYGQFLGALADQAMNPFPNKVEQNIEGKQVCQHVASSKYAPLFKVVWGEAINCSDAAHGSTGFKRHEVAFRQLAVAIAAWESSEEVNSFSSKRDIALAADQDGQFPLDGLTAQENLGHQLFYATFFDPVTIDGQQKFSNCSFCHSDNPPAFIPGGGPPGDDGTEELQRYTDGSYHNIGTPANPEIPGYPALNLGLEGHTGEPGHRGLQKTPTLRNVNKRPGKGFIKAYTHNGWFKSMESIVHFYNTAHIEGDTAKSFGVTRCDPKLTWTEKQARAANCWPAPEHTDNSAVPFLVGDLKLSADDEAAIVAYLATLTDTLTPKPPKPYQK